MPVSKSLRFEVLRRDGFACKYCGARAEGTVLEVDHVLPKSLGGTDTAENLVTACHDCNRGKGSSHPDAPMVADVEEDAVRWARAIAQAAAIQDADVKAKDAFFEQFMKVWEPMAGSWELMWQQLPANAEQTVDSFRRRGLPISVVEDAVYIAFQATQIPARSRFRYMCGICWNKLEELQATAADLVRVEAEKGGMSLG